METSQYHQGECGAKRCIKSMYYYYYYYYECVDPVGNKEQERSVANKDRAPVQGTTGDVEVFLVSNYFGVIMKNAHTSDFFEI